MAGHSSLQRRVTRSIRIATPLVRRRRTRWAVGTTPANGLATSVMQLMGCHWLTPRRLASQRTIAGTGRFTDRWRAPCIGSGAVAGYLALHALAAARTTAQFDFLLCRGRRRF